MVVDTFKTEKDLRIKYPKTKYFKLKDVFIAYWDNFVKFAEYKNLYIRDVVFRDVQRMMICNFCGIKYSKQRSLSIESKLISGTHRHLVFYYF